VYDHVVKSDPSPDDKVGELCAKLLRENFAVVKVEMATKSLTRY
jgi:hypothetical protein